MRAACFLIAAFARVLALYFAALDFMMRVVPAFRRSSKSRAARLDACRKCRYSLFDVFFSSFLAYGRGRHYRALDGR